MRSVYARILIWGFGMLLVSLFGFALVSLIVGIHGGGLGGHMERMNLAAFAEARATYESKGAPELRTSLDRFHRLFEAEYHLLDARGVDLLTGGNFSQLSAVGKGRWGLPGRFNGSFVWTRLSADGRYQFLAVSQPAFDFPSYVPYYLVIFATLALLCWALAVSIASPLRRLTVALERVGSGDLTARVNSKRKDEIGRLGQAFDRMAERIETLVTAERRLLQDISHELRSPLARLSFAAKLVPTSNDPATAEAVARINKEVHRLSGLIGALVEMTRAEGDASIRNPETVSLDGLLADVVEDCRAEGDARGCVIALTAEAGTRMWGDSELLRRAFENVIRNAVQYSPKGSTIEVSLCPAAGAARVCVRDYGSGVPEEDISKIFQPFYRVDGARETATGGVGLGLAIAARAIALHHGTVTARNSNPGLTVAIELPLSL